jgi:hypothetical protein
MLSTPAHKPEQVSPSALATPAERVTRLNNPNNPTPSDVLKEGVREGLAEVRKAFTATPRKIVWAHIQQF